MRRPSHLLGWLFLALFTAPLHAAPGHDEEQRLVASLQLGSSPSVRYLDAAGAPIDYAAFARLLGDGKTYSSTKDGEAGAAVLRIRTPGQPGRFAFKRGDAFPPFELPALQGGTQRSGSYQGRYTLISFFFADCAPCIAEVPTLNAFARQHGDMNVVAITYEDAQTARQFASGRGFAWPILHDGQALIDTLGVSTYPTLILLDPTGHIAGVAIGMNMRDDEAKRLADMNRWIELWRTETRAPL
ncbi:TlpA family protein disulfide reductase [Dyella sp. Tek66A03]|uniref:TlpA family protein disulfide reductase n=1 Tax=Dyella sp. Tek66A03 TaxID=3458298 RepID=UPI00403E4FF9